LIEESAKQKPKNAKEVVEKAKRMKDPKDVRSGAEYYKKWDKVAENLEKVGRFGGLHELPLLSCILDSELDNLVWSRTCLAG
jgi:hypothetical protein